jgi:hypothetical protein
VNRPFLLFVLLVVGACASNDEAHDEPSALEDFIAVNDLERVNSIRSFSQLEQHVVNSMYVIVYTRQEQYLLTYNRACNVNYDMPGGQQPDIRRDGAHVLYADSGTFRGCKIKEIYAITAAQAEELKHLGLAPGER